MRPERSRQDKISGSNHNNKADPQGRLYYLYETRGYLISMQRSNTGPISPEGCNGSSLFQPFQGEKV